MIAAELASVFKGPAWEREHLRRLSLRTLAQLAAKHIPDWRHEVTIE